MSNFISRSVRRIEEFINQSFEFLSKQFGQSNRNFATSSPFGQILRVLGNISNIAKVYMNQIAAEGNIETAQRTRSIVGLASLAGHQAHRGNAAQGEITIVPRVDNPPDFSGAFVFLANYTRLTCNENGLTYTIVLPTDDAQINRTGEKRLLIKEGQFETASFVGTGDILQTYTIELSEAKQAAHDDIIVLVNGEAVQSDYVSLYDMPLGQGCMIKNTSEGAFVVVFGTEAVGFVPEDGSTIEVSYLVNNGSNGNLNQDTLANFTFKDQGILLDGTSYDFNQNYLVQATLNPILGSNPEPTELTKILAPQISESMLLGSSRSFLYHFGRMNYFWIIDIYQTTNSTTSLVEESIVYGLLVPYPKPRLRSGESYFNAPTSRFKLTDTEKSKLNNSILNSGRLTIATRFVFRDPIFSRYVMNVTLGIFSTYVGREQEITDAISSAVSDYMLEFQRRDILPTSDFVRIIEDIEGVDTVNVSFVSENYERQIVNGETPTIGLTSQGDILIGRDEIPIIRGGWQDRYSNQYQDGVNSAGGLNALNILFARTTTPTNRIRVINNQ